MNQNVKDKLQTLEEKISERELQLRDELSRLKVQYRYVDTLEMEIETLTSELRKTLRLAIAQR